MKKRLLVLAAAATRIYFKGCENLGIADKHTRMETYHIMKNSSKAPSHFDLRELDSLLIVSGILHRIHKEVDPYRPTLIVTGTAIKAEQIQKFGKFQVIDLRRVKASSSIYAESIKSIFDVLEECASIKHQKSMDNAELLQTLKEGVKKACIQNNNENLRKDISRLYENNKEGMPDHVRKDHKALLNRFINTVKSQIQRHTIDLEPYIQNIDKNTLVIFPFELWSHQPTTPNDVNIISMQ